MSKGQVEYPFESIAVGGTFDHIHRGHRALIKKAFESGKRVFIGLTSDEFAARSGKKIDYDFKKRKQVLESTIKEEFGDREFAITKLDTNFGPGIFTPEIEAIVVSDETRFRVTEANQKRRQQGLPDLKIVIVPLELSDDGKIISSTRIRAGEIDSEGRFAK